MSHFVHPALKAGNTAVITGASVGGIGYSVATTLLQEHGFKVHLVDVDTNLLDKTSVALKEAGIAEDKFEMHLVDVTKADEVFKLADAVYSKDGRIDFLALNAGISRTSKDYVKGGDLDSWRTTFDVRLGFWSGERAKAERGAG